SVGQPRDHQPQASYALYDSEQNSIELKRVSYVISQTQSKIRQAGLPEFFAERLARGV
ncbi:MAG: metallophosphoesterase, partial [Candidatus Omnitrophica bacterium]|nr:metallophosphoesterase [Candidatus Omnitrophota bacterium]